MQKLLIGRDPTNHILLNDTLVSRRHAELFVMDNGQVMIRDTGSSNGTFVNGHRVAESYLKPGDVVKCASAFLNWQPYVATQSTYSNQQPVNDYYQPHSVIQPQPDVPVTPMFAENNIAKPPPIIQQNVIVVGKAKSVGVAFILAFFFGPLGLLYATVIGGLIMLVVSVIVAIITLGFGLIFTNLVCCVWAVIAANQANANLQSRAGGLINNYQR